MEQLEQAETPAVSVAQWQATRATVSPPMAVMLTRATSPATSECTARVVAVAVGQPLSVQPAEPTLAWAETRTLPEPARACQTPEPVARVVAMAVSLVVPVLPVSS